MDEVDVVVAHRQRVTLRVGDVFLKVDGDPAHADVEVRAMALAPIPTPAILWREPPVLAIAAVPGDAMFDLATLTLGHEERLDDLLAGYGAGADRDVIRAWWSLRSLAASRWLIKHSFDPDAPGCEFDVLRSRMQEPLRLVDRQQPWEVPQS